MSTDEPLSEAADDREQLLSILEDGLDEAHRKVESGRVYDPENEKVRQGWLRVLGYLAGQYRQVLNDRDLEEMEERLEALEAAQGPGVPAAVATDGGSNE